jgi:DNA-binding GntR family transcriptional regulator
MTEDDVKKMEAILKKSREALANMDFDTFIELNTEFHLSLYAASKNEYLLRILQNLRDYFYRYRKIILKTKSNLEDSLKNHEMMILKMKEGERHTVEHLVKEHVNGALKALKKEIKQSGLEP